MGESPGGPGSIGVAVALCVLSGLLPILGAIRTAPAIAIREVV